MKTVEGVKTDALFSYFPPINILAFAILVPLSRTVSARTLHRINVFAIRLTVSLYSSFFFFFFFFFSSPKKSCRTDLEIMISEFSNFDRHLSV